jgi:hypothetical protein
MRFLPGSFARAATLVALLATLGACGDRERPAATPRAGELQTEEVSPPPDARVDVTRDKQERRHTEVFAGVLPGGFPSGLPTPPHSSLVDQGRGAGGAWVDLLIPQRPGAVRGAYLQQLRAAGWEVAEAGADTWQCRRGGARVTLSIHAQGPSTRVRLEY